jgi:hypothetical protein
MRMPRAAGEVTRTPTVDVFVISGISSLPIQPLRHRCGRTSMIAADGGFDSVLDYLFLLAPSAS